MPHEKVVARKSRKLERIFQQTGAGGKTRARKVPHSRIFLNHGAVNSVEIQSIALREHVELVGDCKIQIAPAVREELRHFGLQRGKLDDLWSDTRENLARSPLRFRFECGDDLRKRDQFLKCLSLGDPLGTKCKMNPPAASLNLVVNEFRYSGVDSATEDEQRIVPHFSQ